MTWQKAAFVLLVIFILTPLGSPPLALAVGIALALTIGNPFPNLSGKPTRMLLQVSVVLLGFGMNLKEVYRAGRQGILFTIATIIGTLGLGYLVGRVLNVADKTSTLISSGTAICGGSAIAAVAPAIDAEPDEISVSLATVFVLNSAALLLFPVIGHAVGLSQNQFGIFSAIAIHDTSSVVGAAAAFGAEALSVATTVKLARALWIAPVALFFLFVYRKKGSESAAKIAFPWFILLFILATAVRSYTPSNFPPSVFESIVNLARAGMTMTLFLIGAGLSRETIRRVGSRPLMQGLALWLAITVTALIAVLEFA